MCMAVVPQTTSRRSDLYAVCWLILQSLESTRTLTFWYSQAQTLCPSMDQIQIWDKHSLVLSVVNICKSRTCFGKLCTKKKILLWLVWCFHPLRLIIQRLERRPCHQMVLTKVSGIILVFWGINLYYRPNIWSMQFIFKDVSIHAAIYIYHFSLALAIECEPFLLWRGEQIAYGNEF